MPYQALGDRTRRALVERLVQGPATVSELAKDQPMSLPAVMLHLPRCWKGSGLVKKPRGPPGADPAKWCRACSRKRNTGSANAAGCGSENLDRLGAFLDENGTEEKT